MKELVEILDRIIKSSEGVGTKQIKLRPDLSGHLHHWKILENSAAEQEGNNDERKKLKQNQRLKH